VKVKSANPFSESKHYPPAASLASHSHSIGGAITVPISTRRYPLDHGSTALLQRTLEVLILGSIVAGEMHGLGISRRIQRISISTLLFGRVRSFRLSTEWQKVSSFWADSENNRHAKYLPL
jgi:hypothetical protein